MTQLILPSGVDFAESWFPAFVEWCRGRGPELAGVLSDCAREEFVNSLVAEHMRAFMRERAPLFWARCEWEKVDICFGCATKRFPHGDWDQAWFDGRANELGFIEAKLVYEHLGLTIATGQIETMRAQLDRTRRKVRAYGRPPAAPFGLIYRVAYSKSAASPLDLLGPLETEGFRPMGREPFSLIYETSLASTWPLTDAGWFSLHVGLFTPEPC